MRKYECQTNPSLITRCVRASAVEACSTTASRATRKAETMNTFCGRTRMTQTARHVSLRLNLCRGQPVDAACHIVIIVIIAIITTAGTANNDRPNRRRQNESSPRLQTPLADAAVRRGCCRRRCRRRGYDYLVVVLLLGQIVGL